MASYFNLTLDTTGPANPSILIDGGAQYATANLVDCTISTSDGTTTGYQMKIWGDVNTATNPDIQTLEANSNWVTYSTTQQVDLSSGDGSKTLYLKIRDDVYNESAQAQDSITLDTTLPVVTISGPDVNKISKISGKNVSSFSFQVDTIFDEYKVKVVSSTGASHDTGTVIPTTAGSTNTSGTVGGYPAATAINVSVYGTDLESANAGDGVKIVKVFAMDEAGNWSA